MTDSKTEDKTSVEEKVIGFDVSEESVSLDTEYGGPEERRRLERKLIWKLDCRLSILVIMYILNHVDRNNAAAARLQGFEKDLNLKGQQFNTVISILFVGYILMQVPSNLILNRIGRPSVYLPLCTMTWGLICILTGFTKNFTGVLLARFFLGFTEATLFPGSLFVMSKWYRREEIGLRICILYCGNITSNAFSSLLASGMLKGMEGKLGHAGWRWLFFIDGGATIAVAIAAFFILPDFPTNTRWLTPLERSLAIRRMAEDGGLNIVDQEEAEYDFSVLPDNSAMPQNRLLRKLAASGNGFWLAVTDLKVWWLSLVLMSGIIPLSFNIFFPTLGATLGFNTTVTLVIIAPPWFLAAFASFLLARHSDKQGERCYHIICPLLFGLLGYIIAISTMNTAARYVSLCVMVISYSGYILMFVWISNSIPRPPSKRAVAIGLTNAFSELGNVAGSYVWPTRWGPSYKNSYAICISLQCFTIVLCWLFRQHLKKLNAQLKKAEEERGQRRPGFRYLL